MQLFFLMQSLKSYEQFFHEIGDDILRYFFNEMINKVSHGSSIHELYKHKQGLFEIVCKKVFG